MVANVVTVVVLPFTSSATLLNSAIDAVSPTGETALYDALYWALQRTNLKSGSRVVIAFTDGEENSSHYSLNDVITLSQQTGIPVYIVGVGGDVNRSSLQSLASSCNGTYYDAASDDLAQALRQTTISAPCAAWCSPPRAPAAPPLRAPCC